MIDSKDPNLSVDRQCELIGLNRSTFYYQSQRNDSYNQLLMQRIDEEYTRHPFYGIRRITHVLKRQGYAVNHKRIARLMRRMGLEAIYPKPKLSKASEMHPKYPYLLKGLKIVYPDQVWSSDITYIRTRHGFVYLAAVIDWFSRYVLSFEISTSLDADFCVKTLKNALEIAKPEIFNTDQGAQFTSDEFTGCLADANIRISMDGRGRALDNIFVERLWRSVKYENVYLNDYETVTAVMRGIKQYFAFYNCERPHQSLGYETPIEVYLKEQKFINQENIALIQNILENQNQV